jgi:hypothetical protein
VLDKQADSEELAEYLKAISNSKHHVVGQTKHGECHVNKVSIGTSVSFKDPEHGSETEFILDENGEIVSLIARKPLKSFFSWQGEGEIPEEYQQILSNLNEVLTTAQEEERLITYLRNLTQKIIRLP